MDNWQRQLERFGISVADLPPGSTVINRPALLYEKYQSAIRGFAATVFSLGGVVLVLSLNILRRRKAEDELMTLNAELEHRVEERTRELDHAHSVLRERERLAIIGQIAAGVAHEIKNPLTGIRGFAQLLREKYGSSPEISRYVRVMVEEIDRANSVVNSFLQVARPKEPVLKSWPAGELVREVESIVSPQAFLRSIEVECAAAADLPPCIIDRDQIKQVLLNLCQNAMEAMPQAGTLQLSAHLSTEGDSICISVTDTGCGISPESLSRVRAGVPFYTTKDQGTGLGLSISYAIVKAHGGRVEVESTEGQGTVFRVFLPCEPRNEGNITAVD